MWLFPCVCVRERERERGNVEYVVWGNGVCGAHCGHQWPSQGHSPRGSWLFCWGTIRSTHTLSLSLWSLLSLFFFSCIVFCAYFINFSCSWILVFDWFCVVFEDLCTATHQDFVSMLNLSMYYGAWLISLTFFFLMNGTDSFLCNYVLFILLRDYAVIVLWLMYLMRYCMWFYDFYFLFL